MILLDEEGSRIHAVTDEELFEKHKGLLIEGKTLSITCFLLKETTVAYEIYDFPANVAEKYLTVFKRIKEGKVDINLLFDVIGQIVTVGSIEFVQSKGNVYLKCTLWGEYALMTVEYIKQHMESVAVSLMRFVCIQEFKRVISISNSFNSTKIMFDSDIKIVKDFKDKLPKNNQVVVHTDQGYSDLSITEWDSRSQDIGNNSFGSSQHANNQLNSHDIGEEECEKSMSNKRPRK
ncbi:uncharacterized protein LOC112089213 [Eutrema salsugineum]|uniref:uncharacterized protein LOC112089213 n=1 Tax=Eutrema salsugineum TaxID=72664 RepID=UPI000CED00E2|nr:uncharacterized protein LOC112089213 [Eutrema salsugineum]